MIKLSVLIPCWNQEELVIKALDSIPRRDDIEVLARDDGSTDNTLANLLRYKSEHPELNIQVFSNGENKGNSANANLLLADSTGEYFHFLGNDDTVITKEYSKLIDELYIHPEVDVLGFDLVVNNGEVWHLSEERHRELCAQTIRFIRKSFADGIKFPENVKAIGDWYFAEELLKRNPRTTYTGILAYRYNFPRDGSLINLCSKGIIKE